MNKIIEWLEAIWLNKRESMVYIELLRLGTSWVSNISKRVWLARSSIHYICAELVKKGLVIQSKKQNTKLFTAEHPNKIKAIIVSQKNILTQKESEIDKIMWDLLEIKNPYNILPKVSYHEWKEEVYNILHKKHSIVEDDSFEVSIFPKLQNLYKEKIEDYAKSYVNSAKNWKHYSIENIKYKDIDNSEIYPWLNFKYYDLKDDEINTHIHINSDNIIFISLHDKTPFWIDIKHSWIANDLRKILKLLYDKI
jgi:sugar-specific transcriptional regulator TrmB